MLKKTTQLKQMLQSDQLEFIMEAHNGLSARIVEEAGFKDVRILSNADGRTLTGSCLGQSTEPPPPTGPQ